MILLRIHRGLIFGSQAYARRRAKSSKSWRRQGECNEEKQNRTVVASIVDKGDFAGAKARIKDLETTWDRNETTLKPRAAADWHLVDRAIDKALHEVRAGRPNSTTCKQALVDLMTIIDRLSGKS